MAAKKTTTVDNKEMTEEKVTEKKAAPKRTTKKVAENTAETVEKKAAPRKTTAKKKAEVNTEVFVQFWGKEVYTNEVAEAIKKIWTEDMGKKAEELTDLKIYIKPEDNGAHYVLNNDITGFLAL